MSATRRPRPASVRRRSSSAPSASSPAASTRRCGPSARSVAHPPFIARAEGAYLYDADGNRYIDYFGSWGPMILGHALPPVVEAIERAARSSPSFGASTAAEADLAERIVACYPAIEKMRFVSSARRPP